MKISDLKISNLKFLTFLCICSPAVAGAGEAPAWTLVERQVVQDQGNWQVEYRLRLDAARALAVRPEEVTARVEGLVSNSRVLSHALPRPSTLALSVSCGFTACTDVITSNDESRRCRERARLVFWKAGEEAPAWPKAGKADEVKAPAGPLEVAPRGELMVRLRLEHDHFLHGTYDPLLGSRDFLLELGPTTFRDRLPLEHEHHLAVPPVAFAAVPPDRLDTRYFVSGPDSLHFEAHVPGNSSFKLTETPVRYSTRMRLSYWYLIACGTEGECRVRIQQSREAPNSYKMLSEGLRDEVLPVVGRWVHVEHVFKTEPEATHLIIDFRISGAEIGEMWVDDIELGPLPPPSRP
jgi:hypothetical protein